MSSSLLASIFGGNNEQPESSAAAPTTTKEEGDDESSGSDSSDDDISDKTEPHQTTTSLFEAEIDVAKQREEQRELRRKYEEEHGIVKNDISSKKKRKRDKKTDTEETSEKGVVESQEEELLSPEEADKKDEESRTIFVGNLPVSYTRKQLQRLFGDCGKISSTRIRSVAISQEHGVKLPPEQAGNQALVHKVAVNMGKTLAATSSSGDGSSSKNACIHGYVVFASVDSLEAALKLNNTSIPADDESSDKNSSTRRIRVDRANPTYDASRSIFVGNLPYQTTEDSLQEHFFRGCDLAEITDIEAVRVVRDQMQNCKGFGYILFKDRSMVSTALRQMNGTLYKKRPLRVQVCGRRFKGNNKSSVTTGGSNSIPTAAFGEKKKRWDRGVDESSLSPRKKARAEGHDHDKESKDRNNDPSNVGALRRILSKQAKQQMSSSSKKSHGGAHSSSGKKHHRARGVKKTGNNNHHANAGKKRVPGSKRAAAEAKVEKRVKKIQKRITKGMGKARVK